MKTKAQLLGLLVVVFRFCRNSDINIINSMIYKIYKYLINQAPQKSKDVTCLCISLLLK